MDKTLNKLMQLIATYPNDASLGQAVREFVKQKLNEGGNEGKQLLKG
jgi:hypothetical protein